MHARSDASFKSASTTGQAQHQGGIGEISVGDSIQGRADAQASYYDAVQQAGRLAQSRHADRGSFSNTTNSGTYFLSRGQQGAAFGTGSGMNRRNSVGPLPGNRLSAAAHHVSNMDRTLEMNHIGTNANQNALAGRNGNVAGCNTEPLPPWWI